jgi:peptide/nickel transport system substrate-binding protein
VISLVFIMSKKWCEDNKARSTGGPPQGHRERRLVPRQRHRPVPPARAPAQRAHHLCAQWQSYWGKIEGNVDDVIFTPIGNDATRVAALLSGEIDVMEPVPVQDVDRVNASGQRACMAPGPELRTIFLGMDQKRDELLFSSVKGKNPFKDKRVRQAFYQAIDIDGIQKTVMRGASNPPR